MKRYRAIQSLLILTLGSGCISQIRDEFDDSRVAMFNHNVAKAAYRESSPLYCNLDCPHSFKQGFMAGFIAMMNGANGCPPVFPPSTRICSSAWLDDGTPEDRRNAWYDGYAHGVLAANQTGAADLNRMPARLPNVQQFDMSAFGISPTELSSPPASPALPTLNPSPLLDESVIAPPAADGTY